MSQSYRKISVELARRLRLVMTDVDGTLNDGGDTISLAVSQAIQRLEKVGIAVGLVSGRTLPELDRMAYDLGITGPIIAENGGVARLDVNSGLVELGYSRQPALEALKKLKELYPGDITEREDNAVRIIDVVVRAQGVEEPELRRHLGRIQLVDSGYIMHLMQEGISKGGTLMRLLDMLEDKEFSSSNVMTIGDSLTDKSLFELFPDSVFIPSPRLNADEKQELEQVAGYISDRPIEEGFIEVASHIIEARTGEL
ncbi:HAD-IIB family hydrolase [Chloroflexota bacterium]